MSFTSLRIHPAIGIARVGNSEEYYLGPESMAGMDQPGKIVKGGLPIRPETEDSTIMSNDLRDSENRLKRQAARFRIYQYTFANEFEHESYPTGQGKEVQLGSMLNGKKVIDIIWTVHLANKKANSWRAEASIETFKKRKTPALRNPDFGDKLASPERIAKLVIDAGPRAISASSYGGGSVRCDMATPSSYGNPLEKSDKSISPLPQYPVSFPCGDHPNGIDSLGEILCEKTGRLVVLGGYGKAFGFDKAGKYDPNAELVNDVNNDYWLDDTADGPVTAFVLLDDGSSLTVDGEAWVISTDPAYAPQTTNIVTLWDEMFSTWVEKFHLMPSLYSFGKYHTPYRVNFHNDVYPIFRATSLQMWTTSLPQRALIKHYEVGQINHPDAKPQIRVMNFIRNPNEKGADRIGTPYMPLSLGDKGKSFLSPTTTQYFFLKQWSEGSYQAGMTTLNQGLGAGEVLDKTILFNCLGGRFSPGIEMSFPIRDTKLYRPNWQSHKNGGPFRINAKQLDYGKATKEKPMLSVGYIPLRSFAVEPGDLCKFLALPWHTDYNSCATHLPRPDPKRGGEIDLKKQMAALKEDWSKGQPNFNTILYSSWPAQRPVAVYCYDDVVALYAADPEAADKRQLPTARFSVRGEGTDAGQNIAEDANGWEFTGHAAEVGRFQQRKKILEEWVNIGVVLQAPAIAGHAGAPAISADFYLEVSSGFAEDRSNLVEPWRNTWIDKLYPPPPPPKA